MSSLLPHSRTHWDNEPHGAPTCSRLASLIILILIFIAVSIPGYGQEPAIVSDQTNGVMSAPIFTASPNNLAAWQERLTLGSGDLLNISLYDQPGTMKQVAIGPDGRLNYMQVSGFEATGLTIDELRIKLEQELAKYYLSPTVIVHPAGIRSKKLYLLGNVQQKGIVVLVRPFTILEAVAQAGGFQTANNFVAADFAHSFLVRKDDELGYKKMPVDFEALFLRADFSQNIPLAPDDYLYFAPLDVQEVYVLGEVGGPGVLQFSREISVLHAITMSGGFTTRAWRKRVLLIRGSLKEPQTYVIDAAAIQNGKLIDSPLKAGDIIYVSRKPWSYAQELIEMAINAYIRAVVVYWTGANVGSFTFAEDSYVPNIDD